jgi:hypothetical protein
MKVSKEQLKALIKEELDAVMKEEETSGKKGPSIPQLANVSNPRNRLKDIHWSSEDENVPGEKDDFFDEYSTLAPTTTATEEIHGMLKVLKIDPESPEGQELTDKIKAAAAVSGERSDSRLKSWKHGNNRGDPLASRQPIGMTKSGTLKKADIRSRKNDIKRNLGLDESELEEAKKIKDTYGREVTKAIKDDLKAQDKKNALASIKKQTLKGRIEETEELEEGQEELDEAEELEEVKAHEGPEEKEEHKGETKAEKEEHEKKESAAEEKKEHMKEDKQMEQIAESFRRFTKILKG